MSASWTFTVKAKNERTRNPVSGEFFASDAIKNAGEALIREAIQNSLDARTDRLNGKAKVRIYLSGQSSALTPAMHKKWFDTAWPHYHAPKNGLRAGKAKDNLKCGFLVFEDFGTTGLTGDWSQADVIEGAKNSFFYFFRAEGATEKSADQLGRWGIGKQVFPRSSHTQTFFGYSVTDNYPKGFLMGSCILKYHEINGVVYRPDGYFSKPIQINGLDSISGPITDVSLLNDFRKDFKLCRSDGQTGLSVVVPWLDEGEDGASGFDKDSLLIALVDGYFLPILEGKLEVDLEDADSVIHIRSDNFQKILDELGDRLQNDYRRHKLIKRTCSLIKLAKLILSSASIKYQLSDCDKLRAVWDEKTLSDEQSKSIRTTLAEGRLVQVKVGLYVRRKGAIDARDEFSCYMIKDENFNERPCHIREDLIISNVTSGRANGFATIIRIDKGALANLLGDSENPAHTEWQSTSHNFKDKYTCGASNIKFVAEFASELLRRVHSSSSQIDKEILRAYFNDPGPETQTDSKPPLDLPKPPNSTPEIRPILTDPPLIPVTTGRVRVSITPLTDGFTATVTGWQIDSSNQLELRVAYETAKGDPFSRYQKHDFDFSHNLIKREIEAGVIISAKENRVILGISGPDFKITFTGFDVNRDLIVRDSLIENKDNT